jgi:nucleoside-diphosphate-sugar epimerase
VNIFLTGASGFLGSYFLKKIVEDTTHNTTVLLRNKDEAWRIREYLPRVSIIEADLGSIDVIEQSLLGKNIDTFIHLAWMGVGGGDRNYPGQWRNVPLTLELVDLSK